MRSVLVCSLFVLIFQASSQIIWENEIDLKGSNWKFKPMIKQEGQVELHFMNNSKCARIVIGEDGNTNVEAQFFSKIEPFASAYSGLSEYLVTHLCILKHPLFS
ncbi:MAG: hypothetical protein GY816_16835 [Cytophagales bacterium]|nr:hypothetical protein [Cytophagales bacterium]